MWENKNVSVVLDHWTNGKGDDWLKNFVQHALPNKGDVGYGGCGVIGGSCDFNLDCESMVEEAMGAEYWILKAVEGECLNSSDHVAWTNGVFFVGFHDKLQVAHEFLQDTTIDNILSLVIAILPIQKLPILTFCSSGHHRRRLLRSQVHRHE